MLILTRNVGESIIIGDDIKITVLRSQNSETRIGIEAPRHIPVHRDEVYQKIQEQESANGGATDTKRSA